MHISRRSFVQSAGAAGVPLLLSSKSWAAVSNANEKPGVAIIGVGKQGKLLLRSFLGHNVHIVAVCDVDRTRREDGAKHVDDHYAAHPDKGKTGNCQAYNDFREVLARKDVDLVCIAAPDHWHAYITIAAMQAGKDVYCEKPLTYSIEEAKAIMAVSAQTGRIVQTGAMLRSQFVIRSAAELVRNGTIGKITHADAHFGGPSRPHFDPEEDIPMEPGLDWNLWCGGAPLVKYNDELSPRGVYTFYPMVWRMNDLFGSGYCGDWGSHHLDIVQWGIGMDESGPISVTKAEPSEKDKTNDKFGGRAQSGVVLEFPGDIKVKHLPFGKFGVVFYGTEGKISVGNGKFEMVRNNEVVSRFIDKERDKTSLEGAVTKARKEFLTESTYQTKLYHTKGGHVGDFIAAAKNRTQPCSHAGVGGRTAIQCLLCNISYVHDASFKWNPKTNTFAEGTGNPEWLGRLGGYRGEWSVKA